MPRSDLRSVLTIASMSAAKKAVQNPATLNPETSELASISMSPFITSRNIPKVRMDRGIVIILRKRPIVAFMSL